MVENISTSLGSNLIPAFAELSPRLLTLSITLSAQIHSWCSVVKI